MPTLNITVRRFRNAFSKHNGTVAPNIARHQCIKCAMTVGNAHYSRAFGRSVAALSLASYRAMAVRCVIDFGHVSLRARAEYSQLEATEKINLSYWIGMTFAAIAADEILKVPRLTHATRQQGLVRANRKSRSLADLTGQDPQGRWHVLEAKGRQTSPSQNDRTAWKAQARTVRSINGAAIATSSYCVGLLANPCSVELVDPPPHRREPGELRIDPGELGRGYYQPFFDFLLADARRVTHRGRVVIVRPIAYDPIDEDFVYVGLDERLFRAMKAFTTLPFSVQSYRDLSVYIGTDGVVVATSSGPCDL